MSDFTTIQQHSMRRITQRTRGDKAIWAVVLVLALISLLVVYSSTGTLAYKLSKSNESYLFKQIVFIGVGMMVIYFLHKVNYKLYSQIARFYSLFQYHCSFTLYFLGFV